ncbi:MAG TPA: DUF481 domain-containing protein [Pseudomonadales bacterium]|nr:DUF481 domain-containing protein [Pseudomonadales bacterium]
MELGAVTSTGNTDQQSVKFRADTMHNGPRIKHTFHLDTFRQTQDGVVSANKLYTTYQADYKFDERNAAFGRVSYEDDHFSGYDYQADITFGYNRVMLLRDNMELDGDLGAGERHSKLDDGTAKSEAIVRTALKYMWQISEAATFNQLFSVEFGSNQISRSETSLQSTLVGNLAMKFSLNIKHQSQVPAGIKNTDTETSITVVYNF